VTRDPHEKDMDIEEKQRLRIKLQNFSSSEKKSQVMKVFLSCCLERSNEVINCIKGINLLIRAEKSSDPLRAIVLAKLFVGDQGHVGEYGLCMKLEACGHDVVVSKLLDTYSKFHDVVSLLMDTYLKLVSWDFALWVLQNWIILIVQNELNLITSIKFLGGPYPLSRDESLLLDAAVIQDSSLVGPATHKLIVTVTYLGLPFNWEIYFIYGDDNQGRVEFAAGRIDVFPLCDWDCSSGEGSRNSTVGGNLKVFLVGFHYPHCAMNVVMKPVLRMIENYGVRVGKHYDHCALPEFENFDYRGS
jgi:hypothetical protein